MSSQARTYKEDFDQEHKDRKASRLKHGEVEQQLSAQLTAVRAKLRETQRAREIFENKCAELETMNDELKQENTVRKKLRKPAIIASLVITISKQLLLSCYSYRCALSFRLCNGKLVS